MLHPTDRVIHTIAHAQVWHGLHAMRAIELRQMVEVICLDRRDGGRIDWTEVERAFQLDGHGAVLAHQACLLRALFGWTLPLREPGAMDIAYDAALWRGRARAWVAVDVART